MMLREIRYGINIGFTYIEIDPFGPREYNYHIGNGNEINHSLKINKHLNNQIYK